MATSNEKRAQKLVTKLGTDLRKMQDRHARKLEALNERNIREQEDFLSALSSGMAESVTREALRQRMELSSQVTLATDTLGQDATESPDQEQ